MPRRIYTYVQGDGWTTLNFISTVGGFLMGVAFLVLCYNIYYSYKNSKREVTGDPWDARTLEWATSSAVPPKYNFAVLPEWNDLDDFWNRKQKAIHM